MKLASQKRGNRLARKVTAVRSRPSRSSVLSSARSNVKAKPTSLVSPKEKPTMPKSRQSAAALKAPQPAPLAKAQPWEVDEAPAKSHSGTATPENDLTAEDFEESVPADLAAGSEGAPAKEEPRPKDREIEESGGDSMLARYFREMATHSVMGQ